MSKASNQWATWEGTLGTNRKPSNNGWENWGVKGKFTQHANHGKGKNLTAGYQCLQWSLPSMRPYVSCPVHRGSTLQFGHLCAVGGDLRACRGFNPHAKHGVSPVS